MDAETADQIRKVQSFSRYARLFCMLFLVMLGIMCAWTIGNIVFGPGSSTFKVDFGPYFVRGDQLTTFGVKAAALIGSAIVFVILIKGVIHLHLLFGNLRAGGIYTRENVRHIRQLGVLTLMLAVLQMVLPIVAQLLLMTGVIDEAMVTHQPHLVGTPQLPGLITAGIILLASWIMDIGRKTKEEADELRREAELVV